MVVGLSNVAKKPTSLLISEAIEDDAARVRLDELAAADFEALALLDEDLAIERVLEGYGY